MHFTVVRGEPSHHHNQQANKIWQSMDRWFLRYANRQKDRQRHAHHNTLYPSIFSISYLSSTPWKLNLQIEVPMWQFTTLNDGCTVYCTANGKVTCICACTCQQSLQWLWTKIKFVTDNVLVSTQTLQYNRNGTYTDNPVVNSSYINRLKCIDSTEN